MSDPHSHSSSSSGTSRNPTNSTLTPALEYSDAAVDCAICLDSLEEQPSLTLSCGHRWHVACVQQQLRLASPDFSKRLLFTGYRCAKCSQYCEHPLLESVIRPVSHLRSQVDDLLLQQARVDALHEHEAISSPNGKYYNDILAYARHLYAIFLCSVCEKPYFGGTVDCAENHVNNITEEALPPAERLCAGCSPRPTPVCTDSSHTGSYIWKCRYCCNPADFVCFGNTHLCNSCHTREGQRQRQNVGSRSSLQPLPCKGRPHCVHPLPEGQEHHNNGSVVQCEQVYGCATCSSDPVGNGRVLGREERGCRNLVYNHSGGHGLEGWNMSSWMHWKVENIVIPLFQNITNFVSSYNWCTMGYVVDLRRSIRAPGDAFLEFKARYMARTDCPSVFRLEAVVFDDQLRQLQKVKSDSLDAPADYWDTTRHVLQPTPGACFAMIVIHGKDARFWQGNYGSKVAECSIRVLYDDAVQDESEVVFDCARENAPNVPLTERTVAENVFAAYIEHEEAERQRTRETFHHRNRMHSYQRSERRRQLIGGGARNIRRRNHIPIPSLLNRIWDNMGFTSDSPENESSDEER